ncbi:MAG TPA: DUF4184 family protein [Planctomycetota bacterium]|nr:DUF4184 family protein [Planctomycetota bacterium]
MPAAFPSHQGLLAPLWRRWPGRIAVLPLWVGALAPDAIDGVTNLLRRGELGQGPGHSLFGAVFFDVPIGLLLLAGLRRLLRARSASRLGRYLLAIDSTGAGRRRLWIDASAMALGTVSHVLFDWLSHEHARLLWPFATDPDWFGAWWRTVWFRCSAPGYPDYPIGPHFVAWVLLSLLGLGMFVRYRPRPQAGTRAS